MRLKSEDLVIREFTFNDDFDLFEMCSDKDTAITAGWKPHPSIEVSRNMIATFIYEKDTYAIVLKNTSEFIGTISLYDNKCRDTASREIGFCINKRFRNKGYVTQAIDSMLNYVFDILNVDIVVAVHDENNFACEKALIKNNFKLEGCLRKYRCLENDVLCDCKVYSIIKEEFRRN